MSKPFTIEDLRNPTRKSGFRYVSAGGCGAGWQGSRNGGGRRDGWRGPLRRTPEQAAQDYCDYVNGLPVAQQPKPRRSPKAPVLRRNLQRAVHATRRTPSGAPSAQPRPRPIQPQKQRSGFVYLIGIMHDPDFVKVGWSSTSGFPRLAELQTGNPNLLVGLAEVPGTLRDEYKLHCRYEPDNILNEWFRVSPELLGEFEVTPMAFAMAVDTVEIGDLV